MSQLLGLLIGRSIHNFNLVGTYPRISLKDDEKHPDKGRKKIG